MSVEVTTAASVDQGALLRQLTAIQARRFATHPLFLAGVVVLAPTMVMMAEDAPKDWETFTGTAAPAFLIGVMGLIVSYRLTVTEDRALEALKGCPVSPVTRTLALCGACLVPASVGLVWFLYRWATLQVWPIREELFEATGGWIPSLAILFAGSAVACLGAPLLGVAVGRWLWFPGAGVIVAIVLTVSCAFVNGWAFDSQHGIAVAIAMIAPYRIWVLTTDAPYPDYDLIGVMDGSPLGYLVYAVALCGLAMWVAVLKDARPRRRMLRSGVGLGALAAVSYAWAVLG